MWELIVPLATLFIYGASYFFQLGYNSNYGLPSELVSLDLSKISFSLIPLVAIVAFNIVALELIYEIAEYNSSEPSDRAKAATTTMLLDLCVLVGWQYSEYTFPSSVIHLLVLLLIFLLIAKYIKLNYKGGVSRVLLFKLRVRRSVPRKREYKSYLEKYIPNPVAFIYAAISTTLIFMLIFAMGSIYASFKTSYLVEAQNPSEVVLNSYGADFIVGKMTRPNSAVLTNNYQVVDLTSNPRFTVMHIRSLSNVDLGAERQRDDKLYDSILHGAEHLTSNILHDITAAL